MLALPAVILVAILVTASVYIVDVREKALVTRFGEVILVREEPGLGLKMPIIDQVVTYDARILGLQTDPMEITPLDDRRLVVDAFARWQIVDVVQFRRAVGRRRAGLKGSSRTRSAPCWARSRPRRSCPKTGRR